MITQKRILELLDVDIHTGICRWKVSRGNQTKVGDVAGYSSGKGYRQIRIDKRQYYIHRIIWFIAKGYWPKELDHKDGNKLNNAITNLREATSQQNKWNTQKRKNNTSGFKGVRWVSDKKKWKAEIYIGKAIHLGYYNNKHDAAHVYNKAVTKYHGKYAQPNVIEET